MTRFVVPETNTLTVLDTETNLSLGFTFEQAATAIAAELNDGDLNADSPFIVWLPVDDIPVLTDEELHEERSASVALATALAIPLPDYAQAWAEAEGIL